MLDIGSYPSTFNQDSIDEVDNEPLTIKQDETLKWLEKYYPTTSCGATVLRFLRFLRMACIILPVLSMVGSLFTHTTYIAFAIEKSVDLWALIPGIKSDSRFAELLGIFTIGIIGIIATILILRFLWTKLIKDKFLTNYTIRLNKIRSAIFRLFLFPKMIASEMKNLGIIGNDSDALLKQYRVNDHTFEDCCALYYKYRALVQRYNSDRMGPYDIAKERQVSQFRLSSIFFLLVLGIGSHMNQSNDTFSGEKINYGVMYNVIIGLLEDAAIRSTTDHKQSKFFSWLKRKTTSHYALMFQQLTEDESDEHNNSLKMYTECCENSFDASQGERSEGEYSEIGADFSRA